MPPCSWFRGRFSPGLLFALGLFATMAGLAAGARAAELTPEQRALILGKPGSVTARRVVRIPLEGTDHRGFYRCSYLRVYVNDHGPYTFLFDTGASFTALSTKVIDEAHVAMELDRGGHHDLLRVKVLRVGGVEIRDYVTVRDDDFGVDGILGSKSFGDMNLVFKLASRALLVSPKPVPLPGGFEVPYVFDHNVPTIPVTVGALEVPTLIDTGDDAYAWELRSDDLKGAVLAHAPVPADEVLNGARTSQTSVSTLASSVKLGPLTIDQAVVGINDALPVPDFGVDFLKEFNVEFEPRRMVVVFQPLARESGTKIRGNLSAGFKLKFDHHGTVSGVIPGSAAEQRGMHSGDRILSIDGTSIEKFDPRTWDMALAGRKHVAVRWLHENTDRTDDFEVTEIR